MYFYADLTSKVFIYVYNVQIIIKNDDFDLCSFDLCMDKWFETSFQHFLNLVKL